MFGVLSIVVVLQILSLLPNGVLEVAQIVYFSKVISAINFSKNGLSPILRKLYKVLRLSNFLLLDGSIFSLFDRFYEIRDTSYYLVQVSRYLPLLAVENFRIQIFSVIKINMFSESSQSCHLGLREWVLLVEEYFKLEMLWMFDNSIVLTSLLTIHLLFPVLDAPFRPSCNLGFLIILFKNPQII